VSEPRRAVLLGRVSRGDKHTNPKTGEVVKQNPENQLIPLRSAAERLGWPVVEEIPIPGLSAWDAVEAREVQRRILAPFQAGRADVLMCWSLDRVVRGGVEEAFRFLRRLERDLGVDFWSLNEPFLNSTSDPQQRELMISLLAWVAKWESQRRSDRLKAKAEANRNRAGAGGGRATWGRGKMPTHEDEARVRALAAAGESYRSIQRKEKMALSTISRIVRSERDERVESSERPDTPLPMGQETNRRPR
jgi:DNA invertase Pin-like site-specific DNA recombinase